MKVRVARVDFFTKESVRLGDCNTFAEAEELIQEFCCYDFAYDFTINGRSLLWYYEQGLAK